MRKWFYILTFVNLHLYNCPFFNWAISFLAIDLIYLYVFYINPLSGVKFTNISLHNIVSSVC